ncbi:hypothetical protein HID58_065870, partial [Brassica napus]
MEDSLEREEILELEDGEKLEDLDSSRERIHDPVKIMVPCGVVEVESPIPPDRSTQLSPYI